MLRCPYNRNLYSSKDDFNADHIIPKVLGGSNKFTIQVSQEANSAIDRKIDSKVKKDFLLSSYLYFLGVKNEKRKLPAWEFNNSIINGHSRSVHFNSEGEIQIFPIQGNERQEFICPKSGIKKISHILFNPSDNDVEKKKIEIESGRRKRGSDFYWEPVKRLVLQNPEISNTLSFDLTLYYKLFSRIALGASVYLFGLDYLQTKESEVFSKVIFSSDLSKLGSLPKGQCFPNYKAIFVEKNKHTIIIQKLKGFIYTQISLFGELDACFVVSEKSVSSINIGEGVVFIVDPVSRSFDRHKFPDYLKLCAQAASNFHPLPIKPPKCEDLSTSRSVNLPYVGLQDLF